MGFVELLAAIAVAAILAAATYAVCVDAMRKVDRHAARQALLATRLQMAQVLLLDGTQALAPPTPAQQARMAQMPGIVGRTPNYTISLRHTPDSPGIPGTYLLVATPLHSDACGELTLSLSGQRGVSGATLPLEDCW